MLISKFGTDDISGKIESYENLIGRRLPEQLRGFLEKYNGGETPNTNFCCNNVSSDLRAFYGFGKVKYSLDKVRPMESKGNSYLPFACDSFGNEVVIDLQSGVLFFMDHEKEDLSWLTADLRDFVKICDSKPINPASLKTIEEREQALIEKGRGDVITEALRDMWRAEIEKYSSIKQEEVVI